MRVNFNWIYCLLLLLFLTSCGSGRHITSKTYHKNDVTASYYHKKFNGRKTASGEVFRNSKLTAAHKNLPFGTLVKVTNPQNNKSVKVRINDRGPFIKGREIDLSQKAFDKISDNKKQGLLKVNIKVISK